MARSLPVLFATMLATACNGPLPFLSGGALSGPVAEPPAQWSEWGAYGSVIQFETNPAEPYSVNIAYTVVGETLYVNAGDTKTKWVEHMEADPRVRLRRDGTVYELRAERVTAADEIARFGEAWTDQSFFRRDPATLGEVWIYRLDRR